MVKIRPIKQENFHYVVFYGLLSHPDFQVQAFSITLWSQAREVHVSQPQKTKSKEEL